MPEGPDLPTGLRILIVEDEVLIALDIEEMLLRLQCEVVGPAATIAEALSTIAGSDRIDGAILDLNLQGETVLPVVHRLNERSVPFVIATGYVRRGSDHPALLGARRLAKPFGIKDVEKALRDILPR
jgi:CheY-like chemotaxis protein